MLQSGNLQIQNSNLGPGNLSSNSGSLSSGGRGLTGPTTYISVENDPIFSSSPAATITNEDIERWNQEIDLSSYITSDELAQELSSYVSNSELDEILSSYATISYVNSYVSYVLSDLDIDVDLSSYVSDSELAEILASYATKNYTYANYVSYTYLGDLNEIIDYIIGSGDPSSPENLYATRQELETLLLTYATKNYVDNAILNAEIGGGGSGTTIDLSYYLRKDELPSYLISYVTKNELNSYVSKNELNSMSYVDNAQLQGQLQASSYATQNYVNSNFPSYAYVLDKINSIPGGGGNTYVSYNTYNTSIWQGSLTQYQNLSDHTTYQLYLIAQE